VDVGENEESQMNRDYDYVIVGSGVAATLVCDRVLTENPLASILVLEAGGRIPSRDRRIWWDLVLAGRLPYERTYDDEVADSPTRESYSSGNTQWGFKGSRVRAYGGSTMHWGGWALRYKEEDFSCRSNTGQGADWPFGYDELEPWYALAEQVLSVGGEATDQGPKRSGKYPLPAYPWSAHEADLAAGFESIDLVPGHMPIARFNRCMNTATCKYCPIGSRYSAQDHLDRLLFDSAHRNLCLKTSAPVRRIIAERGRAHGVEYYDKALDQWVVANGDEIVVCAGTYESTKLLLASVSPEWPMGIGNRYDQVGRYIVTHLRFGVEAEREHNEERLFQEYDFPTLMSRSWDTPREQASGKMFVFNNRTLPRIEFERLMIEGKSRAAIEQIARGPSRAGIQGFIEEFGDPQNCLTLAPGEDRFGLPKTRVTFSRREPFVFEAKVTEAQERLLRCLESLGYKRVDTNKDYPRGDHASGSCRMGHSPDASVTNADLAIHDVDNLFICSNAVLPNSAAVNPTLTLAALALRLGAHLAQRAAR
jgi:choline dehydrogenase-like flavoprotein